MYAKNPYESKCQLLINKCKDVGLKHAKDLGTFIEYSNDVEDLFKSIEEYNPWKKIKVLIVFDDMNDVIIVTKLFIRVQKLIMSFNFISLQLYFHLSKDARANTTHFFITNIPNGQKLQVIAINCSFNNDFDEFKRLYRNLLQSYIQYLFLVICTLPIR